MRVASLRVVCISVVALCGCALSHGRSPRDSGEPPIDAHVAEDAGRVAVPDAGIDAFVPGPDGGPLCIPEVERCDGLDQDCDALIDETTDSLCAFRHAVGACIDGACRMVSCDLGFADCDGDPGNGCEVELATDRANCGECGDVCRTSQICMGGACEADEIVDLAYATRGYFGCVALASGRLVCWGHNEYGAIASGTTDDQLVPRDVDGIDDVVLCAISIGMICAARSDGSVWCRGGGELGIVPAWREVLGVRDVIEIRAGLHHFCVLESSGRVACWGKHGSTGSLGIGPEGPAITWDAVEPLGVPPAVAISADDANGCAVDAAGTARCWGWAASRTDWLAPPSVVSQETGAIWLSHATAHACFIGPDHVLRCWGEDDTWGANAGAGSRVLSPVAISAVGAAEQVWVTEFLNSALNRDGRVFWWGQDLRVPFVRGVPRRAEVVPQHVPGLDGAARLVMGEMSICGQLGPTSLRCFGWNFHGALGDGTYEDRPEPVVVVGFE